jgi:hypothetical protein
VDRSEPADLLLYGPYWRYHLGCWHPELKENWHPELEEKQPSCGIYGFSGTSIRSALAISMA